MPWIKRLTLAMGTGATGLAVMGAMLHAPATILHTMPGTPGPLWLTTALGAGISGLLLARFFGHPGLAGLGRALLGALLCTILGAAICGLAIALGAGRGAMGAHGADLLAHLIWSPLLVLDSLLRSWAVCQVWLGCMGLVHLCALVLPDQQHPALLPRA